MANAFDRRTIVSFREHINTSSAAATYVRKSRSHATAISLGGWYCTTAERAGIRSHLQFSYHKNRERCILSLDPLRLWSLSWSSAASMERTSTKTAVSFVQPNINANLPIRIIKSFPLSFSHHMYYLHETRIIKSFPLSFSHHYVLFA